MCWIKWLEGYMPQILILLMIWVACISLKPEILIYAGAGALLVFAAILIYMSEYSPYGAIPTRLFEDTSRPIIQLFKKPGEKKKRKKKGRRTPFSYRGRPPLFPGP
jgi:hypothetical protein